MIETSLDDDSFGSQVGFSQGMAPVWVGGKYGYMDMSFRTVIEPQFEQARSFCGGLAAVSSGKRYGFIDKTGTLVIKPQFASVERFSEGVAVVSVPDSAGSSSPHWTVTVTHSAP